jgi:hypothetical protein
VAGAPSVAGASGCAVTGWAARAPTPVVPCAGAPRGLINGNYFEK